MRNIKKAGLTNINKKPGRENAIVGPFQIPVPQRKGPKGNYA